MRPVSPVLNEYQEHEIVVARDQPTYHPLPTLQVDGSCFLTRWRMTWKERIQALLRGDIYLWVIKDDGVPFQPVKLQVEVPK